MAESSQKAEAQGRITKNPLTNEIRPGTSGIGGHHYESKLLGLLLHRARRDSDIDKFYLGTNIKDLGDFDDIVFKYYLKNDECPKIFFVQAKHKDKPKKEPPLTINTLLKSNDIFSLNNYYESYKKVKKNFNAQCVNVMFNNDIHNLDYSFLIYTPLFENFKEEKKKIIQSGKETLLLTNKKFKAFVLEFDVHDKSSLSQSILLQKGTSLAKAFAEKIETENYGNMMLSELIRVYHVYLAKNVVEIISKSDSCLLGRFSKNFLSTSEEVYVQMKKTIFKKLKMQDCLFMSHGEINKTFKLPLAFGNLEIPITEEYHDLCKLIKKLMRNINENNIICIDEDMVGRNKLIKNKEMESFGKFVGQMLFQDITTGYFKFYFNNTENHKILLEMLKKENVTISVLRSVDFDIKYKYFPHIYLCNYNQQKDDIEDFLSRLKFYTNQAKEDEVEEILKKEINECFITENVKNTSTHFNVDAIYLNYHYRIQQWWQHPDKYITKACKFYENAKNDFLCCSLVDVLNYIYVRKMNNYNIVFDRKAVDLLGLNEFINTSDKKVYYMHTTDSVLTSIKIIQYLKEKYRIFKFVTLDSIISQGYSEDILNKISLTKEVEIVILVLDKAWDKTTATVTISSYVNSIVEQPIEKVIIISPSVQEIPKNISNFVEHTEKINTLDDFNENTKLRITEQKSILFQGKEVSLASLLTQNIESVNYFRSVQGEVLSKMINNKLIKIGTEPNNNEAYCKTKDLYINRRVCRCVRLTGSQYNNDFTFYDYNKNRTPNLSTNKDVIVIFSSMDDYNNTVSITLDMHANKKKNIHFFHRRFGNVLYWVKSYGSIQKLFPYIERCVTASCLPTEPETLLDLDDRVVIITAGPGSGKSTLVTHLMMQTKYFDEAMCILKMDFLDLINELKTWKKCSAKLKFLLSVLYKSFSLHYNENNVKQPNFLNSVTVDLDCKIDINSEAIHNERGLDLFELQTFTNLYNNGKMLIIFDGFDEICPYYKNEAIDLFKVLISSRVQKLWITSRSNIVLNELECEINTFSFALNSFTSTDQIDFFTKISKSYADNVKNTKKMYHAMITISSKIDFKKEFTGTPLHLRMIADILKKEDIKSDIFLAIQRQSLNVTTLYKKFVDFIYYDIRFGEKQKGNECSTNPDLKNIIEAERNTTMENHKLLAAYSIMDKILLTTSELALTDVFIKNINTGVEKTGIIESIYNSTRERNLQSIPKFVHFTFAEYFASEFICDRIRQCLFTENGLKYLVNDILATGDGGIRWFIDSKMSNEKDLAKATSSIMCSTLLLQRASSKSALDIALLEDCVKIAEFLLNNIYTHLHQNQLNDFIILITQNRLTCSICCDLEKRKDIAGKQNVTLLTLIINIIAKHNASELLRLYFPPDGPNLDLFKHSLLFRDPLIGKDISLNSMLSRMNRTDFTKLATTLANFGTKQTILHARLLNIENSSSNIDMFTENLWKLSCEQSMLIFGYRDKKMRVPAHYAALKHNYRFFKIMHCLVGKENYREICTLTDSYGFIPFRYFEHALNKAAFANVLSFGDFLRDTPITTSINKIMVACICNYAGINICLDAANAWHNMCDIENPYCVW